MAIEKITVAGQEVEWDTELGGPVVYIEKDNDRGPKVKPDQSSIESAPTEDAPAETGGKQKGKATRAAQ